MIHEFTDVLRIGSNFGFIFGYNHGELIGYSIIVPCICIVSIDDGGRIGSLVGSYDYSNDSNTVGSMICESLGSYDGSVFCSSDGFFDGTKYGIFVG